MVIIHEEEEEEATTTTTRVPPPGEEVTKVDNDDDKEKEKDNNAIFTHAAESDEASSHRRVSIVEFRRLVLDALSAAEELRTAGNALFTSSADKGENERLSASRENYLKGLERIDAVLAHDAVHTPAQRDILRRATRVRLALCLNMSLCELRGVNYLSAEEYAREAMECDPRSVKAIYRLCRALMAQGKYDDAVMHMKTALELDPMNTDVKKMMREAEKELRAVKEEQKSRYGGLFDGRAYEAAASEEDLKREKEAKGERRSMVDLLKKALAASNDDGVGKEEVVERWASSGPLALNDGERQMLEHATRRAAAAGHLDAASQRAVLDKHGLGGAFTREAFEASMDASESERWAEQQRIERVKRVVAKSKNNETLTDAETKELHAYLDEEVVRLETKLQTTGLSQEERFLLSKLREKRRETELEGERQQDRGEYIEGLLKKAESMQRVSVRERLRLVSMLEEEEDKLTKKDDEQGLTGPELRMLTELTRQRKERDKVKRDREIKKDMMERAREKAEAERQAEALRGGDIIV